MDNDTYEISLIKIKEGQMKFVAAVFEFADGWVNDEYPEGNAKAYVRNASDGSYEVFVVVTELAE
jgi:hypothetical protein